MLLGALLVVLAGVGVAVAAWQGGDGGNPSPPSTTAVSGPVVRTRPPSTTLVTDVPRRPELTAERKPVERGVYDGTAAFRPSIKAQIKDGWNLEVQTPDLIELSSTTHANGRLQVVRVQRLYRPIALTSIEQALGALDPVPSSLADWLGTHRFASRAASTDIPPPEGASAAKQVDVTFSGYAYPGCKTDCVALFNLDPAPPEHPDTYPLIKISGERAVFQVFVVGGSRVVVAISAPAADFDTFRKEAQQSFSILGFGEAGRITGVSVRSARNPSTAGDVVTLTAVIDSACVPTGTVSFTDGRDLRIAAPVQNGAALIDVTFRDPATYRVVAAYDGNANCDKSSSVPLIQSVAPK